MEEIKLNTNKIKSVEYLINKVGSKEEQLNTPLFSFLIGAGCSISSKIPSGKVLMNLCSHLSFLEQYENGVPSRKKNTSFIDYIEEINMYIGENFDEQYKEFKKSKEGDFKKTITKDEISFKTPNVYKSNNIINENEVEEYFREKIHIDNLYGKWFETFSEDPRERQKLIENIIDCQEISGEYIIFSYLIKQGIIHNIFTTNFDDILHESLSIYASTKSRVFSHNETVRYVSINSKKPNIIKLHGDYLFENIKNTTEETGELENNMSSKLNEALSHLGLIVIGYNGADYSIMNSLTSIKSERPFPLIWCVRDLNTLHWRVIHLINTTPNSYVVEIQDFTTLAVKLWNRYGEGNFDLRRDAAKRQASVTNALKQTKSKVNDSTNLNPDDKKAFNETIDELSIIKLANSIESMPQKVLFLTQANNIYPDNVKLLNLLGYATLSLDKEKPATERLVIMQKAVDILNKALTIDENSQQTLGNLSTALRSLGAAKEDESGYLMLSESLRHLKKAIEIVPDHFLTYANIGMTLRVLAIRSESTISYNLFEEGINYFDKALSLRNDNKKTYASYGNLLNDYWKKALGNPKISQDKKRAILDKSIFCWRTALKLNSNPDNYEVDLYLPYTASLSYCLVNLANISENTKEELAKEAFILSQNSINLKKDYLTGYINLVASGNILLKFKTGLEIKSFTDLLNQYRREMNKLKKIETVQV